jgi:hypothetical protein
LLPFDSASHNPSQPYDQAILANQKQAFANTDSIVWSPRFSFAWQPLGISHSAVIRGGIGIFYDPVPGIVGTSFAYNSPLYNFYAPTGYNLALGETNSLSQNALASNSAFTQGFAAGQTLVQIQATDANFIPPSFQAPANTIHSPQYQKWSLQLQQSFRPSTSLTIGYFGNHGIHELAATGDANAFGFGTLPATQCSSPPVPPCGDPRFGPVMEQATNAVSNYNGMVVSFEQRFTRWGNGLFQANYTYGHALDEVSNGGLNAGAFTSGSWLSPQDPNNLRGSYGSADYDVRHSFNANYVWEVPVKAALRGHGSNYLVKGWHSGPTAELGTWLRPVSIGVSVTTIQSVREKELHLLQQPPHPVTVVRDLQRLLPSQSRFSTSPSRVRGFYLLLPRAHTLGSPDRHRSQHPSAL